MLPDKFNNLTRVTKQCPQRTINKETLV